LGYRYVDEANLETKEITYQKTFGLWADAIAFADAGKTFLTSRGELRMGAVKLQGSGKWVATRVVRG
jgi:hypothetical protein